MRVNLTIDVPDVVRVPSTLPARGAIAPLLRALVVSNAAPSPPLPVDRIERAKADIRLYGEVPLRDAMRQLSTFAASRPVTASSLRTGYVWHGSLRVPHSVEGAFETAVRELRRDAAMRAVIARVEHARTDFTLRIVHNGADAYEPDSRTIVWDPHSALRTTEGGRQCPALGLGHELAHAAARPWVADADSRIRLRGYDNAEERRVIRGAEAHAARTLGEAQRYDHRGTSYRVRSAVAL